MLIAVGARVTATDDALNKDTMMAEERRRTARTIDAYLEKNRGIDVTRTHRRRGAPYHVSWRAFTP